MTDLQRIADGNRLGLSLEEVRQGYAAIREGNRIWKAKQAARKPAVDPPPESN